MKISGFHGLIRRFLSVLFLVLFLEATGTSGRVDFKTKLLLQNIRTHLAQRTEEILQQKQCESDLTTCGTPSNESEENDGESEEGTTDGTKTTVRTFHKPDLKMSPKGFHHPKQVKEKHKDSPTVSQKKKSKREENTPKPFPHPVKQRLDNDRSKIVNKKKIEIQKEVFKKPFRIKEQKPSASMRKTNEGETTEKPKKPKSFKVEERRGKEKPKRPERDTVERRVEKTKTVGEDVWKPKIKPKPVKQQTIKQRSDSEDRSEKSDFPFPTESFFFLMKSNERLVGDDMCKKHSNIYLKQLKKHKIWALMMFDASAKIPPGILQGNINQYGDFDECLSINAVFKKSPVNEPSAIRGKYCLANLDLTIESTSDEAFVQALERIHSFSFIRSTVNDPSHFIPRFTSVNWGLCVPDTCAAADVEKFIIHQLKYLNSTSEVSIKVNVAEDNCVVKTDFKLTETVLVVLLFYGTVVTVACYATYIDEKERKGIEPETTDSEKLEKELEEASRDLVSEEKVPSDLPPMPEGRLYRIIMAFSLRRNLKQLLDEEKRDSIGCLNGIKALFSIMLFFAHKTIPLGWTAFSNRLMLTKMSNEGATAILRTSIIYTDSFLLISGLLTAYNLSKEINSLGRIRWRKRMAARYIRLTPALLAVLVFYAFVWDHTGSGPLWSTLIKKNSKLCEAYMWRNLLYIQNLFPFEHMCAPQTHQLALDMQLTILAPLFVHILYRYEKVGFGMLQAFFLVSSIVRYLSTSRNDLSVVVYHGMPVSQLYRTADLLYTQTLHRASPYLMGSIVGYYMHKYKAQIGMPRPLVAVGWILAFACGFYSVVSPSNMASRAYSYDRTEAAQYASLSPISWSISLAWIIFACHLGFGGKLNEFLCNKVLLVFSRISYSFYLTQFLVFFYKVGVKRVPEVFTFTGSFDAGEFFVVVVISTILTLLFDIPMAEIKKIILERNETLPGTETVFEVAESGFEGVEEETEDDEVREMKFEPGEEKPEEPENVEDDENLEDIEKEPYDLLDDVTDDSFPGETNDRIGDVEDEDADVEEETDELDEENGRFETIFPARKFYDDDQDPDWLKDD